MNIYTKAGDKGQTMLQDGIPIPKHHPIIQAMAALDEVNAQLGMIKSQQAPYEPVDDYEQIQKTIMAIMSLISYTSDTRQNRPELEQDNYFSDETSILESQIQKVSAAIPAITSFVAYGSCQKSAQLDIARAVTRRAETFLSQAAEHTRYAKAAFAYVNRLSDFLYIRARYADFEHSIAQAVEAALGETKKNLTALDQVRNDGAFVSLNNGMVTLSQAKIILDKIENKAAAQNLPIVAACCNASGNPVAVHVMDDSLLISYEAAIAKAYTAASLKMPTASLCQLVQPGQPFYGLETLGNGKIIAIGGGVPLFDNSKRLIGAIGVSGGTAETDHELAMEGANYFASN